MYASVMVPNQIYTKRKRLGRNPYWEAQPTGLS